MSFKECTSCEAVWNSRKDFLSDPQLVLAGYQANFGELNAGFFLFQHRAADCGTCLAIAAGEFTDMHDGPMFDKQLTGTKECLGHCADKDDLSPCQGQCECSYVRHVLQEVKNWPKLETSDDLD